jgi:DMSO/TMAO reductase YedYZ molybdopterin-dependent catalytic subunit
LCVWFFLIAICTAYLLWNGLRTQEKNAGTPKILRQAFRTNETIFSNLFNEKKLVKTYPVSEAVKTVWVNGLFGLKDASFDPATWRMKVLRNNGDTLFISIEDIKKLPKTEVVFDFKCIEGWSQKTWWGGVTLEDFVKHYGLESEASKTYVSLSTPDRQYYVGIDMRSMTPPQTILCYEMNGKPLPLNRGYPLRLIIPVKYGIKHIKRIGTVYFSDTRPPYYWAE